MNSDFDETMASFDGAETFELVGLCLLSHLQPLDINVILHREDGLAVIKQTPRNVDLPQKQIFKIFNENGLKITKEANKKIVDFLHITLDLRTQAIQKAQRKYEIHKQPKQPPTIHNQELTKRYREKTF